MSGYVCGQLHFGRYHDTWSQRGQLFFIHGISFFITLLHTVWDKCNTTYEYYSYLESKGLVKGNFSPKSSGNHHLSYHSLTFNCNPNSTRYLLFERWIEIFSTLSTYLCYTYAIGICLKNENYSTMIYYYTERFYYNNLCNVQ